MSASSIQIWKHAVLRCCVPQCWTLPSYLIAWDLAESDARPLSAPPPFGCCVCDIESVFRRSGSDSAMFCHWDTLNIDLGGSAVNSFSGCVCSKHNALKITEKVPNNWFNYRHEVNTEKARASWGRTRRNWGTRMETFRRKLLVRVAERTVVFASSSQAATRQAILRVP